MKTKKTKKKVNIFKIIALLLIIIYTIIIKVNDNNNININIICYTLIVTNFIYINCYRKVVKK